MKNIRYIIITFAAALLVAGFALAPQQVRAQQTAQALTSEEITLLRALLQRFSGGQVTQTPAAQPSNPVAVEAKPVQTNPTKTPVCYVFSRDLGYGSGRTSEESRDVERLQDYLRSLGYTIESSEMKAGATFGESTAAAVVKFQARYGITQTGYVGPRTRAALNTVKCVPASSIGDGQVTQPVDRIENAQLSAMLTSQNKDKVGIWDMFTSGRGNTNSTKEDWEIKAYLSLTSPKKISRITITHPSANEGWSTSSNDVYGRKPYPLGVYSASQPDVPLVTGYNQVIETTSGVNTFLLYGQKETGWLKNAVVVVTFTDGSSVSAQIAGVTESTTTVINKEPAVVQGKPTPTVKLNKLPEKKELGVGDKLYWGWKTENFPVATNGTDHISMYLVPVDGSERVRWAVNFWVHEPNQPQYATISERTITTSKIVGKEFRIRIECQEKNATSKTCSDESTQTFIIKPLTATPVQAVVNTPQAAPTAIGAIVAPVVTITNPAPGSSLMKGNRYTFKSISANDLRDVVFTMRNLTTGQVVRTVKADIVAAQSTFEWTIPSFFPDGEYRLEVTSGGSRVEVVNATYRVVSPVSSSLIQIWDKIAAFF